MVKILCKTFVKYYKITVGNILGYRTGLFSFQSIGFYLNWLMQLGSHTDAFEQHSASYGASERGRNLGDGAQDGPEYWFQLYTFTYWSWWLTWSPIVGKFYVLLMRGNNYFSFSSRCHQSVLIKTTFDKNHKLIDSDLIFPCMVTTFLGSEFRMRYYF